MNGAALLGKGLARPTFAFEMTVAAVIAAGEDSHNRKVCLSLPARRPRLGLTLFAKKNSLLLLQAVVTMHPELASTVELGLLVPGSVVQMGVRRVLDPLRQPSDPVLFVTRIKMLGFDAAIAAMTDASRRAHTREVN